jgi:UDP-N-acetylmuramyl tripeptide synthase
MRWCATSAAFGWPADRSLRISAPRAIGRGIMADPLLLTDSRRLTGPNLYWARVGAVLDVAVADETAPRALQAWEESARVILDAVGWRDETTRVRRFPGGASLVISAPIDALYAATEVNDWALGAANAALTGAPMPDIQHGAALLRHLIEMESQPSLLAMHQAAAAHRVTLLVDEHIASVGTGTGCRSWTLDQVPAPDTVDWSAVHDVPTVLVTGSNGKTTTVRLLTAVLTAAGRAVGMCCSDTVNVAGEVLERGDWSGPGGARRVLRDPRVEVAVLETARGGILRRGLAADRADAAIITNVAEDHFGEFGITDLAGLAEAKLVVARALGPAGRLVLNGADPELVRCASRVEVPICWFAAESGNTVLRAHIAAGGEAVTVDRGSFLIVRDRESHAVAPVADVPITLSGAARHNVSNVLGVIALATALGVEPGTIARGLTGFHGTAADNPGRLNLFELAGVTILVDFAHNPHGMQALVALAASLPARRRLIVMGQAGDRDDVAIAEFARSAWAFRPDRIVLKEMEKYLRGRATGDVTGIMEAEFLRLGAPRSAIAHAASEYDAVVDALHWAESGDLLLLPLHSERERCLALFDRLQSEGWAPGHRVPG